MNHIYLCGPVTGRKRHEAANHFAMIEQKMRQASDRPVFISNPMKFCPANLNNWQQEMRICIGELIRCHGIALLQGWQRSKGAALEIKLAQDLHIPVVYIEPPADFISLNELFIAAPETGRYYRSRLDKYHGEGALHFLAEDRATADLTNRYLNPHGFEYKESSQED